MTPDTPGSRKGSEGPRISIEIIRGRGLGLPIHLWRVQSRWERCIAPFRASGRQSVAYPRLKPGAIISSAPPGRKRGYGRGARVAASTGEEPLQADSRACRRRPDNSACCRTRDESGAKGRGSQDRSLGNPRRVGAGGNGESFQENAGTVVGLELQPPLERNLFRQIAELVVAGLITPRAAALGTNDRGVVVIPVPHMAVLAGVIDLFAGRENGVRILGLRRLQGDRAGID